MWALLFFLVGSTIAADFRCSFDQHICGFINPKWDDFNWNRRAGATPSKGTGPSGDHTSGKGKYMYLDQGLSRRQEGEFAVLEKRRLSFKDDTCVTFWYHMYGVDVGYLDAYVDDMMYFSKEGNQGDRWHKVTFKVDYAGSFALAFEASWGSGCKSEIAIDDVQVGTCTNPGTPAPPTGRPTPLPPTGQPTPPPPTGAPSPPPPTGAPPPSGSCGRKPAVRIVGGADARQGDWPWQAGLMFKTGKSPFCGGTLVHPQWIVTATHCVEGESAGNIKVRLGGHKREVSNANVQDMAVAKIIRHPSYEKPIGMAHDLTLLKLVKPAVFNSFVHPACLPESVADPADGTKCYITGWGRLASGGKVPDVLQVVSVPVVSKQKCNKAYPNEIHDSMICAGLDAGGKDSCQGDSGGPLVCESGGRFYLHGATSWGYGCAAPGKFGVYARVKYLMSWVKTQMAKN